MPKLLTKFITLLLTYLVFCPSSFASPSYTLAVTDIVGLEELQREFGAFESKVSQLSGLKVKLQPVTSRTAVVEALNSKKIDFVLTGPAEYIVLRKKTKAEPIVALSRPDYFSAIVVLAAGNINNLADLKGKKVAFGDFGSTSYHLAPVQLIKDFGLDPTKEIKALNVSKHVGWESLKRGQVDALGIKYDQYLLFRDSETKMEAGEFRVIGRGPDLPNDVLAAAPHVDPSVKIKLQQAFGKHSAELVKTILVGKRNVKYEGMKFITSVKDSDYNYVREMYRTIGYPEFSEFVG